MRVYKNIVSVLLSLMMVLSVALSVSATDVVYNDSQLTYSFVNNMSGYAQGTITFTPAPDSYGDYYLFWADDVIALEGYSEITVLSITSGSGVYEVPQHTPVPVGATKVIAVEISSGLDEDYIMVDDADAVFNIPESKQTTFSKDDMLYSFASISDPQIANDSYGSGKYPYDEVHWKAALETMAERNVDFAVSSGDTVNDQNGNRTYNSEYQVYQRILADSSYANPIYEAIGNHEVWADPASIGIPAYIRETGLDSYKDTITAGKPYFEITEPVTGDHFIFMALEGTFYTNQGTQFSTAQLDWLEGLLEKYNNDGKNIFIIEHGNIAGWGSGDKLTEPYYYDLGLNKNSPDVARFINLMEKYKECVIITAHTHLELGAQLNYSDNDGTSAVMIHNSAVGGVRRLVNGVIDRTPVRGLSEGYIVEVYEDCILFNGINLYHNEIMPSCSYIIPFTTSRNPLSYGDTDLNKVVNIHDVSNIQRDVAKISFIDNPQGIINADVTSDGKIDINDATVIQKYLAGVISYLPVSYVDEVDATSIDIASSLINDLGSYYRFSSFDQYMALKKIYNLYKTGKIDVTDKTVISDIVTKQKALYEIAETVSSDDEIITVYFTNNHNWDTVKAYIWGSDGIMESWPGTGMHYEKDNDLGEEIYSISFDFSAYQNIIFTDGTKQTADIKLTGEDEVGYYINGETDGKYTCGTYDHKEFS